MDSALSVVQNLEKDLQEVKAAARDGKLKPLPGETVSVQTVVYIQPSTLELPPSSLQVVA